MSLATTFNYFANSLWQVPVLVLCCGCGLRLMRASARVRYAVWIVTLLLSVGLPLRGTRPLAEATVTVSETDVMAVGAFVHPLPARAVPFYVVRIRPRTRDLLAELYLLMTGVFLLRLLVSHLALRRLVRASSTAVFSTQQRAMLAEFGAEADLIRVLPPSHGTPMVAGVWRPLVLLPATLLEDGPIALRAVLAHEMAHLRRRDTLVNLLLRAAALPVAYNPATTLIHRQIQHARELLCDAAAAQVLPSPGAYAQVLLRLAQQLVHPGGDTPRSTVGLFERTSKPLLEERIINLIAPPVPLRVASRVMRFMAAATVFGGAAALVSAVHLTPSVLAAEQQSGVLAAATPTPSAARQAAPVTPVLPQAGDSGKAAQPPALTTHEKRDLKQAAADLAQAGAELRDRQLQRDLKEASDAGLNTAHARKQLDEMRARLNSPEFKREMAAAATAETVKATQESAGYRKQVEEVRRQLDSPEFKRQMAEALKVKVMLDGELAQLVAETKEQALLPHSPAFQSAAAPQGAEPQRVAAGIMSGAIQTKVAPVYPPEAKAARISGSVVMHALIGKDGAVSSLEVISGPPELRTSALDAVRQWVYQPYLLNGEPTEVDTTVTVNYSFGG